MTLPSFTADHALYASAGRYRGERAEGAIGGDVITMQYFCADCWCLDTEACYVKSWPDGVQTCKCIAGHHHAAETLKR